jgi:hypothetical protein
MKENLVCLIMENLLSNVHHVYLSFILTNNKFKTIFLHVKGDTNLQQEETYAKINNSLGLNDEIGSTIGNKGSESNFVNGWLCGFMLVSA